MKVAIVTGGASGIGAACVEALQAEGLQVGVVDLSPAPAADASALADIRDATAVVVAFAELEAKLGPCEHLVTCAGVYREGSVDGLTLDEWLDMLQIHVGGTTNAFRVALPGMLARGQGSIVAIGSELGLIGDPSAPHYAASKGRSTRSSRVLVPRSPNRVFASMSLHPAQPIRRSSRTIRTSLRTPRRCPLVALSNLPRLRRQSVFCCSRTRH